MTPQMEQQDLMRPYEALYDLARPHVALHGLIRSNEAWYLITSSWDDDLCAKRPYLITLYTASKASTRLHKAL